MPKKVHKAGEAFIRVKIWDKNINSRRLVKYP